METAVSANKLFCGSSPMNEYKPTLGKKQDEVTMTSETSGQSKHYEIQLNVRNTSTIFSKVVGIDLFTLLGALNTDVFESVNVIDKSDDGKTAKVLVVYKHFGKEMGVPRKYSAFKLTRADEPGQIRVKSAALVCPQHLIPKGHVEQISDDSAMFCVIPDDDDRGGLISYSFSVHNAGVPAAARDLAGLLMKKVFTRLKTFLESVNK